MTVTHTCGVHQGNAMFLFLLLLLHQGNAMLLFLLLPLVLLMQQLCLKVHDSFSQGGTAPPPSSLDARSTLVEDQEFKTLFQDESVIFPCLDDIEPIFNSYKEKTGLRLCIWKSKREKYRYYKCKSHVKCSFESRRSDVFFVFESTTTVTLFNEYL